MRAALCLPHAAARWPVRRALTLVELMVSLIILAIISMAIFTMMHAGAQVSGALTGAMSSEWEVETAICRIVQQARNCSSLNVPGGTTSGTTFSLVTEPDSANGNQTYPVTYALATVGGVQQLQETDARYGTSVLVHNVQSFDVHTKSATGTQVVILSISVATSPPVTRTVRVTPRNQ